jgi:hypothetical protein
MKNVPHLPWLIGLYILLVAVPVYFVYIKLKRRLMADKTALNLLFYFVGLTATAFIMHFITLAIYFKFIFPNHK